MRIVALALILLVISLGAGFESRLNVAVGDGSITAEKLARGALSRPEVFDRGFRPDTATICIVFDDNYADTYSHVLAWNDSGFVFGFGIVRQWIGNTGRLTESQIRTLHAKGNEILNHSYSHNPWLSHCNATQLEQQVNDAYRYLTDTLGVEVHGFDYPGGDYNDAAWLKVAELHDYASGLYAVQNMDYEADSSVAYDASNKWWRYVGSLVGKSDSVHCGTSPDSTFYSDRLIFPGGVPNPWLLPIGWAHGPGSTSGTLIGLESAKAAVRFVQRNGAAASFYFHSWDSAGAWIGDWLQFVKQEVDAGRLRVRTQWWIVQNYCLRPLAAGANLFPAQHLTSSWGGKPDGWQYGLWDAGTQTWWLRNDGGGFAGNQQYAELRLTAGGMLSFARYVPGGCYVYASIKANAYGAFATASDSVELTCHLDVRSPDFCSASALNNAADNGAYDRVYRRNASYQSDPGGQRDAETAVSFANGYQMQSRGLRGNRNVWKELRSWQYVGDPCVVVWKLRLRNVPAHGWKANRGIKLDDVIFTVIRRTPVPGQF